MTAGLHRRHPVDQVAIADLHWWHPVNLVAIAGLHRHLQVSVGSHEQLLVSGGTKLKGPIRWMARFLTLSLGESSPSEDDSSEELNLPRPSLADPSLVMSEVCGSAGDIGPKPSKDRADRRQYWPHRTRNSNTSGPMAAIEDNVSDHKCQA